VPASAGATLRFVVMPMPGIFAGVKFGSMCDSLSSMRWKVKIRDVHGDVLVETLAAVGYLLEGDMLSGEQFAQIETWGEVADAARELSHRVSVLSRHDASLRMGFSVDKVFEYDSEGNEIGAHTKVWVSGRIVLPSITASGAVSVISDLSPEQKAEMERKARIETAAILMRAVMRNDRVISVMRLLGGQPGSLELGHVHDIIQDDMNGDLSQFGSTNAFSRFTGTLNSPAALGFKARHAIPRGDPIADPMDWDEMVRFITNVVEKWIREVANK